MRHSKKILAYTWNRPGTSGRLRMPEEKTNGASGRSNPLPLHEEPRKRPDLPFTAWTCRPLVVYLTPSEEHSLLEALGPSATPVCFIEAKIRALVLKHPDIPPEGKAEAAAKALHDFKYRPGNGPSESLVAEAAASFSRDRNLKRLGELMPLPAIADIPENKGRWGTRREDAGAEPERLPSKPDGCGAPNINHFIPPRP